MELRMILRPSLPSRGSDVMEISTGNHTDPSKHLHPTSYPSFQLRREGTSQEAAGSGPPYLSEVSILMTGIRESNLPSFSPTHL